MLITNKNMLGSNMLPPKVFAPAQSVGCCWRLLHDVRNLLVFVNWIHLSTIFIRLIMKIIEKKETRLVGLDPKKKQG